MSTEDPTGERTFLHDMSNIIAIVQGTVQMVIRKIQKNPAEATIEEVALKLEATTKSVTRMIDLLNARREVLRLNDPPS
jgi:hypothetical protein